MPHAGAPIVLHGHIPDFRSSSEGGIWSCRGLDPVFQEVLWPNGQGVGLRKQKKQVRGLPGS